MDVRPKANHRGSTLILVVVLLAVLSVIGVAAVSLGSQERVNAAAKGRRDALAACASAARMALWAELARHGAAYLTSSTPVGEIVLADGTKLAAPAHYTRDDMTTPPLVVDIIRTHRIVRSLAAKTVDLTNRMDAPQSQLGGTAYTVVARCKDAKDREQEVEFTTIIAL